MSNYALFDIRWLKTPFLLILLTFRVGLPEEFGLLPGDLSPGQMVACLKELGFDLVLDTNTAADLTIMEEGTELLHRIQARLDDPKIAEENTWPLFTSCCPGMLRMFTICSRYFLLSSSLHFM